MRMPGTGFTGEAFNFGLELRPTMLELTERILAMMERADLRPVVQNIASAEIREQYLDAGKARERLGWSARYGMDEGLRRTIDWYRTFLTADDGVGGAARDPRTAILEGNDVR